MNTGRSWNRNGPRRGGFRGRSGGKFQHGRNWGDGNRNQFRGGYRGKNQDGFGGWNQQRNRPKRDYPTKRLSEEQIAVTEYITDNEGFTGVIKSRYSDFQVSEINLQGEVAKLTDLSVPQRLVDEEVNEDEELLLSKYNPEILPMETWDRINKLAVMKDPTDETVEVDVTGMAKEVRTRIHEAVKKAFGEVIIGSTVTRDDKKFVCFQRPRKGVRIDKRVKWPWAGEYVHFVLHKENCDTMDAAVKIAERLRSHIKPSMIGYAGTKDRRAKTSQWFSIRRTEPAQISGATRGLREMHIGNFSFKDHPLKLGMLKGNVFRIALRNVTAPDELVEKACSDLQTLGFINYYGLQRFGTRLDVPTYEIGNKLLLGEFKEAIDLILEDRPGPTQAAVAAYRREGAEAAAAALPSYAHSHVDAKLIRALAATPADYLGALCKVPRNMLLLYVHAYQSIVWNRVASARLRRHGHAPAPGDLVPMDRQEEMLLLDENEESEGEENDIETTEKEDPIEKEIDKEETENQDGVETAPPGDNNPKQKRKSEKKPLIKVKVLTKEDVESGKYSIFDVILPLPGYSVEYPTNMKAYYEELMTKDGLTLQLKQRVKIFQMCGAYRQLVARPVAAAWSTVRYNEPNADLILSDIDELNNVKLDGIVEDGKYKALLLSMSLPSSSYATMALRELLKVDTACDFQALQNNYHRKRSNDASDAEEKSESKKVKSDENEDKSDSVREHDVNMISDAGE